MDTDNSLNIYALLAVLLLGVLGILITFIFFTSNSGSLLEQNVRGYYSEGFENHSFLPCNTDESWWVSYDKNALDIYKSLATEENQLIYMELKANVTSLGEYGHMGSANREIEVLEVILAKSQEEPSCEISNIYRPLVVERLGE